MNGITKWLKDKKNNILIPNTLTKTVYDDEGKNLDEILISLANQNAFSNVKIGSTTIDADSTTDTLTIVAGDNIIITPDAENGEISISSVGSASFEELSYTDYKAGNYDPTKSYAIPDYPYENGKASEIAFDDSVAKLGADKVQGAIEANTASIEATKKVETGTLGKPITTGTYANEMLMKKDGIVYLSCRLHGTSVTGYTVNWISLPEGFRPKSPVSLNGHVVVNGTRMPILMYIPTSGAIQQSYGSAEVTELCIAGSFIAAE